MNHRNRSNTEDLNEALIMATITLWRWRTELALTTALLTAHTAIAHALPTLAATIITTTITALLLAHPKIRSALKRTLRAANVRRQWSKAVVAAGATDPPPRRSRRAHSIIGPRAGRITETAAGDLLQVKVGNGRGTVHTLTDCAARIAAEMDTRWNPVREIRVHPNRKHSGRADVLIVRRDPFENQAPTPWPHTNTDRLTLWDPIPIGINEDGHPININLIERNLLIGGEPGAGKSVALSLIVATGALDPNTQLWLLDGKDVELTTWEPCATQYSGPNITQAINVLKQLRQICDHRYTQELKAQGLRKINRNTNLPLHLLIIDELAYFTAHDTKKHRDDFNTLLADLARRGRAAGIIICAATQKPDHQVVPTAIRDLINIRLAFRCNTPQASDTILGQGWAASGYTASNIPLEQRGVGLLLAEGDRPIRMRGYYLDDTDIAALATRSVGGRAEAWLAGISGGDVPVGASDGMGGAV